MRNVSHPSRRARLWPTLVLAALTLIGATAGAPTFAQPPEVTARRVEPNGPTLGAVLDQRARAEGWCVVWNAPFEPVGPAPVAWRYRGPGDSLTNMVERGTNDWDRATSARWQITDAEDYLPHAIHTRMFLDQRRIEVEPVRDEEQSPPGLNPLYWGACDAIAHHR